MLPIKGETIGILLHLLKDHPTVLKYCYLIRWGFCSLFVEALQVTTAIKGVEAKHPGAKIHYIGKMEEMCKERKQWTQKKEKERW